MKKVAIFTNHYAPENFRINALVDEFKKDLEVDVITQIPNYPHGDYYPGYSVFKKRTEDKDNVHIERLFAIPRKNNKIMLSLNYISYALTSFVYGLFNKRKVDHVLVYMTSPIFLSWGALRLAKRNQVKSTAYVLDLWPGSLIMILNIKNKFIQNKLYTLSQNIYKRFDHIVVSSPAFKDELVSMGVEAYRISYIPQHADEISEQPIAPVLMKDKLEIIFAGNIGQAQRLDLIVDAVACLKARNQHKIHFTIVGDGRYKTTLEHLIETQDVSEYFTLVGRVEPSKVKRYLENKHFGYVSLVNVSPINKTIPAKVQSYMAYGLPILAASPGALNDFVSEVEGGLVSEDVSAEGLALTLESALRINNEQWMSMHTKARDYACEHFDIIEGVKQFKQIMKEGI